MSPRNACLSSPLKYKSALLCKASDDTIHLSICLCHPTEVCRNCLHEETPVLSCVQGCWSSKTLHYSPSSHNSKHAMWRAWKEVPASKVWKCSCCRPRGVKHRPHMVLWPPHSTLYPAEHGLEPFFTSLLVIQSDSFWGQLDWAHNTSNSCPAHFWLLSHLINLLVLASMTTVHQTKRQERFVLGSYHRYEMNLENSALGLVTLEESSEHMLSVKFGGLSKDQWLLRFRSTFFGLLAAFSV